ncbi:hypothetical protein [Nonomuraea sp. NPDC003709]|uniref:hypothetical protein n=1 Tax=Nonomuraea sp. NPDC003709 TaxID=3154450 RepID=UPI0033B2AC37
MSLGSANTKLAGLDGSRLDLYDDDRLVLSVVDPTLIPASSFIDLQTSTGRGHRS